MSRSPMCYYSPFVVKFEVQNPGWPEICGIKGSPQYELVPAALTANLLDAIWFSWATAGNRMLPFLGLVVVCIGGLWLADKLSREKQRL